ncbi:MAG: hypothetical protein AAGG56_15955 [Pseudomonadota bacterium]
MIARGTAIALALLCAGCGLWGGDTEEAEPAPMCMREDPGKRKLEGVAVRNPTGVAFFEAARIEGKARRNGNLSRIWFEDYTFKARPDGEGGYSGRRGAKAIPVDALDNIVNEMRALALTYPNGESDYAGLVAIGRPTPAARVATTGEARYSGPVELRLLDLTSDGGSVVHSGQIDIAVRFSSADARATVSGLGAGAQFTQINWDGLAVCNTRIASSGRGGFQFQDPDGRRINFAGPSDTSSSGTALLDATFYGFDDALARPAAIGGIVLIQGDSGVLQGVFAAPLSNQIE